MSHQSKKSKQKTSEVDAVYEMLWDCEYCGNNKLLGKTQRFCPQCGAGQDPARRYYPADAEKIAVHEHKYVGADKACPACSHPNSGNSTFCTQCGSPLDEAKAVATREEESRAEAEKFAQGQNQKQAAKAEKSPPPLVKKSSKSWLFISIIVGLLSLLLLFIFWTKAVSVRASGFHWQRVIYIEDYAPRNQGAWCDALPYEAYNVSREKKIRDYKKIPDGQTCRTQRVDQGDGTYREKQHCETKYRKEPIYAQYCHYKVDKWASHRQAKAQGDDKKPYWPKVNLACEGKQRIGCERESGRDTDYLVQLSNLENQQAYTCELSEKDWQAAQVGSHWQLEVSAMTGGERCDSLVSLP